MLRSWAHSYSYFVSKRTWNRVVRWAINTRHARYAQPQQPSFPSRRFNWTATAAATRVPSRSRHRNTRLNGVTPQKPVIFRNRTRFRNHCATHCHIVRRSFTHKQEIRNSSLHLLLPSFFITHFFFLAHYLLYRRRGSLTSFLLSYVSLFIFCSFRLSQRVPA